MYFYYFISDALNKHSGFSKLPTHELNHAIMSVLRTTSDWNGRRKDRPSTEKPDIEHINIKVEPLPLQPEEQLTCGPDISSYASNNEINPFASNENVNQERSTSPINNYQ